MIEVVAQSGGRLDKILAEQTDFSRSAIQNMIKSDRVTVNGTNVAKPSFEIYAQDCICFEPPAPPKPLEDRDFDASLQLIAEHDHWVAINKQAGIAVHPGAGQPQATLADAMVRRYPQLLEIGGERPGIVHRLDKDTSGCLVWALDEPTRIEMADLFATRKVYKQYIAWVNGEIRAPGSWDEPIRRSAADPTRFTTKSKGSRSEGRSALTHYWPIALSSGSKGVSTLLALVIETGRTHQIRVHCADHGRSVIGDRLYSDGATERMMLHAQRLGFVDPVTGESILIESQVPPEFALTPNQQQHCTRWHDEVGRALMERRISGV